MERRTLPRPQRVLIVDDSDDIRQLWMAWLTFWGFLVDEARNGAECLSKADANVPDLVLMDLWMPVLDGFTATSMLKSEPKTASVPVLALSAAIHPTSADRAIDAGCDAFLPKGIDPDQLLVQLRRVFGEMRSRVEPSEG